MSTESKVGAFVLGSVAVLAFTIIRLLGAQLSGHVVPYHTYLHYAGGLEPGSAVLFGGMSVGRVTAVRPAAADPTKIEIQLDVKENTPLNEKSVAKLGFISVMSGAALSVTTGSNDAKRLPAGSEIPSQEAASLDAITAKMAGVADNANGLITEVRSELQGVSGDAHMLLANLNTVTGKDNQRKVRGALDNVNAMLATERPKIDHLTDQLNALSLHADETIQNVNGTVSDMRQPIREDLVELQKTLLQTKALLGDMQVIVQANDYKINDTIDNLRMATENLGQLTDSVKQQPWSLIRIKQPIDRQVPK
jgi:ABC-type transporter Mla subunit MlaD